MNGFVVGAIAMLLALIPCGIVLVRGSAMAAVVAFEAISAVLVFGSGLVFARFLGRGL